MKIVLTCRRMGVCGDPPHPPISSRYWRDQKMEKKVSARIGLHLPAAAAAAVVDSVFANLVYMMISN